MLIHKFVFELKRVIQRFDRFIGAL